MAQFIGVIPRKMLQNFSAGFEVAIVMRDQRRWIGLLLQQASRQEGTVGIVRVG